MSGTKKRPRRLAGFGILVFGLVLPACRGDNPWYRNQPRDGSGRIVYRPTYPAPGGRNYYVSGYGGSDYSPGRPRKNALDCPVPPVAAPSSDDVPAVTVTHGSWDGD